jgi:hypothetical protein
VPREFARVPLPGLATRSRESASAEWKRLAAAAGLPLNRWLRRAVNDAAQLERTPAQVRDREVSQRLRSA